MEKKSKTYRSIVSRINHHIDCNSWSNTPLSKWHVGISSNPRRKMSEYMAEFGYHIKYYIAFYAYTEKIASQVEDYFSKKGTSHDCGGRENNENSRWVYVYKDPRI